MINTSGICQENCNLKKSFNISVISNSLLVSLQTFRAEKFLFSLFTTTLMVHCKQVRYVITLPEMPFSSRCSFSLSCLQEKQRRPFTFPLQQCILFCRVPLTLIFCLHSLIHFSPILFPYTYISTSICKYTLCRPSSTRRKSRKPSQMSIT